MPDTEIPGTATHAATPVTAPDEVTTRPNGRKVREGIVSSTKMQKTIVVNVVDKVRHDRYSKTIQRTLMLHVHDETNEAKIGDRVRVQETRPLSKTKRWRLVTILERAR